MFSLADMKSKIEAAVAAVYEPGGTAPQALDAVMTATDDADKERLKRELVVDRSSKVQNLQEELLSSGTSRWAAPP